MTETKKVADVTIQQYRTSSVLRRLSLIVVPCPLKKYSTYPDPYWITSREDSQSKNLLQKVLIGSRYKLEGYVER
jgi:hypothetical protein